MQEWISSPIGMHPVESGQWVLADDAKAERERLAAENAELRKEIADLEHACDEMGKELSVQYQLELEAKCHDDLEESHKIMVEVVAERDADLAAANATLDALREAVRDYDDNWQDWEFGDLMRLGRNVHAILYPQPAALAEENDEWKLMPIA